MRMAWCDCEKCLFSHGEECGNLIYCGHPESANRPGASGNVIYDPVWGESRDIPGWCPLGGKPAETKEVKEKELSLYNFFKEKRERENRVARQRAHDYAAWQEDRKQRSA